MVEHDSPWKESLDIYFERFLLVCFPAVHRQIDWTRGYEARDKELQKISPKSESGARVVDKLMRVYLVSGDEEWILVHIEVQSQSERAFPERMFVYHYRIRDRYNRGVASLAVLGDDLASWRPDCYRDELLGCRLEFHFPIVKLLDFGSRSDELERSDNPFSIFVLAHLVSLETRDDPSSRYVWKFRLVKGLYQKGWGKDEVRRLFRLIDWVLDLPRELAEQFSEQLCSYEEETQMTYVTSIERLALEREHEKGLEKGLRGGIESVLEIRFGVDSASIMARINELTDVGLLERILQAAKRVDRPEDLARLWSAETEET